MSTVSLLPPRSKTRFPEGAFYGQSLEEIAAQLEPRDVFEADEAYPIAGISDRLGIPWDDAYRLTVAKTPDGSGWLLHDVRGRGDQDARAWGHAIVDMLAAIDPEGRTYQISPLAAQLLIASRRELIVPPLEECDLLTRAVREKEAIERRQVEEAKAAELERRRVLFDELGQLLTRQAKPQTGDAERLIEIMAAIPITESDVRDYARCVEKFRRRDAQRAEAAAKVEAAKQEYRRLHADFEQRTSGRRSKLEVVERKYREARAAFERDCGGGWREVERAASAVADAQRELTDRQRPDRVAGLVSRVPWLFETGDGWPKLRHAE